MHGAPPSRTHRPGDLGAAEAARDVDHRMPRPPKRIAFAPHASSRDGTKRGAELLADRLGHQRASSTGLRTSTMLKSVRVGHSGGQLLRSGLDIGAFLAYDTPEGGVKWSRGTCGCGRSMMTFKRPLALLLDEPRNLRSSSRRLP